MWVVCTIGRWWCGRDMRIWWDVVVCGMCVVGAIEVGGGVVVVLVDGDVW